ncbi:hypothetical protein DOTSEDRAFT_74305, partial [Dothistroma septosporum NZE10]
MPIFARAGDGRGPLVADNAATTMMNQDSRYDNGIDTNSSQNRSSDGTRQASANGQEKDSEAAGSGSNDNNGSKGDGEGNDARDEEQQDQRPTPVGFWHPSLKHVRREAMTKWTITTAVLMAFILSVLSIYWGVFTRVEQNLSSLVVYVIDFDGQIAPYNTTGVTPLVGPQIVQMANRMVASGKPHLGFGSLPVSDFDHDPIQVRQAVYNFDAWAAIIINPNATSMLYSAVQNGNTSYDPLGACQLVYSDARDDTNWFDFIYPQLAPFMTEATTMVGQEWTRMVMQNATTDNALLQNLQRVPQALSPAIGFSMYNLRPFYPYTSIPAVSIGLIYLIIISFFSFAFYLPIHFKYLKPEGHPPLKF